MNTRPDAILVGDIHARDDQPTCRLDDFLETQKMKFKWLKDLWRECGEPCVIQSGDLFNRWKSSPQVINMVLEHLPPMITIPGNPGKHNYYNVEGFEKDALKTLDLHERGWKVLTQRNLMLKNRTVVLPAMWGDEIPNARKNKNNRDVVLILLTHMMIVDGPTAFGGVNGEEMLKKHPAFDLILTGHNHKPMEFVQYSKTGRPRLLVNPGSFTRQSASETHQPRVYLWSAERNEVEIVHVPIEDGVITRDHIDVEKEKDERILAFVERLMETETKGLAMDFRENLERRLSNAEVKASVVKRLREVLD